MVITVNLEEVFEMLIKLNGLPWEKIKVPDVSNQHLTIDLRSSYPILHLSPNDGSYISPDYFYDTATNMDKLTYWLMHQTPPTDHAYKAACWSIDKVLTALGGG